MYYICCFIMVELNLDLHLTAQICSTKIKDVEETKDLTSAFALVQDEVVNGTSLEDEVIILNLF